MQLTPPAEVGMALEDVDTPALLLDLDALDRNIARMAELGAAAGVRLRPHAKTHKCPAIALRQIAAGAVGQCAQKVGEAEALVEGGVTDVLVSNQVVGASKLRRLAELAERATIAVCFDHAEQVDAAAEAAREAGVEIGGLIEIEVGMARCGVAPGPAARDLARRIADAPNLKFRGLQAYHGRAQHLQTLAEREQAIARAVEAVKTTIEVLDADGLPCREVCGAGTGTFQFEARSGVYTELQVGSYVFMDVDYARIGGDGDGRFTAFEHSLFVLATVMSVSDRERAVLDAGLKSLSGEKGVPWVHDKPGIEAVGISDEHTNLRLGEGAPSLRLGEKLALIPGHCDPTVNLHDWYVGVRNGRVEELLPITARGASR